MINKLNFFLRSEKKFLKKVQYNKDGYYVHQTRKSKHNKRTKVSVIMPTYNAENTIISTIDSIINQTIGFSEIELLIIDDFSIDSTRNIILNYAKKHSNIIPVFLEENSGAPSIPRNLGISLATSKYITFIDSDDWFHSNGILSLFNLLEETNDNYAVGKTVRLTDNAKFLNGPYNSWATRKSISPYSIEQVFQHLGPTGRMMKREFIIDHNITFPNMKFAEDKLFFIDVLINCKTISTSKDVIYFTNRFSSNESLTTTTTIFEQTDTNIFAIKYVAEKKLPGHIEKMILNRLYGFDCINRLFNRGHFLKSENKKKYFDKFAEVLETTKLIDYDFTEYLSHDWQKILVKLFYEKRYDDIVSLIKWNKSKIPKELLIENNIPYNKLPFDDYYKARIEMAASHISTVKKDDGFLIIFNVYGDFLHDIFDITITNRKNELDYIQFPINQIDENTFSSLIIYDELDKLSKKSQAITLRYSGYKKIPIRMNSNREFITKKSKLDLYATVADNLGLKIKKNIK